MSFEPLPREFFAGAASTATQPSRLSLPRAKFEGLRALGADRVGLLRFDARMAALSAREFVERVLVRKLAVREVWVGPDFRFGHGRAGDLALLRDNGRYPWLRRERDCADARGWRTRIEFDDPLKLLAAGDLDAAERLLGSGYAIAGKVLRGQQLGRRLGYPTANLRLGGRTPALGGIFATRVRGTGFEGWPSVSSLGTRPTVEGTERLLEAHLFDFGGDLYGQRIEVEFVAKLRDELRFDDLDALTAQMHRDAAQARAILGVPEQRRGAIA